MELCLSVLDTLWLRFLGVYVWHYSDSPCAHSNDIPVDSLCRRCCALTTQFSLSPPTVGAHQLGRLLPCYIQGQPSRLSGASEKSSADFSSSLPPPSTSLIDASMS